ncbi:HIRAN domain protein [Clostridium sp. C105KSO15]|nr:HIRAN domain protein [Clostridium sp. C105KSO15]
MFFLILIVILIYIINSSSKSSGSSSNNSSSSSSSSTFHSNSDDEIQTNISRQNISQEGHEFYTKVAGVTYDNRQQYVKQCYNGQQLDLVRDKFNPYDKNAIAIYAGDNQVGFLSKELAQKLAPKMDSGIIYECFVECVTGETHNINGLNIKISPPSRNEPITLISNYDNPITNSYSDNDSQNLYKNNEGEDYNDYRDYYDDCDDDEYDDGFIDGWDD